MQEKELKVSNFNGKEYIEKCISKLEDPNLPVMERRRLEAYVKNYQIRSASTTEEKQRMIEPTVFQIEKNKPTTKKHASNIKCKVGLAILITTVAAGGVSLKLQHDRGQKRLQFFNDYPKTFSQITIQKNDTLSSIAAAVYSTYPEEVRQNTTVEDVQDEIIHMNHIQDENKIIEGRNLIIPNRIDSSKEEVKQNTY